MSFGSIEHPGYKNRSIIKGKGGYQNIRMINGRLKMIIGAIDYGHVDMSTPEKIAETLALRDERREKLQLPKASY